MFIAALFSIELKFDTMLEINILPHIIQAILFFISIRLISQAISKKKEIILTVLSLLYIVSSLISYIPEIHFMYEFGYKELLPGKNNPEALLSYSVFEFASIIECAILILLIVMISVAMKQIILDHTAIPPNHERYSRADSDYHKAFILRSRLLCASGVIMAISRCINIFVQAKMDTFFFFTNQPLIAKIPSIPWFGLFVFITAAAYGGFALYFTSILKEDSEMKYIEQ